MPRKSTPKTPTVPRLIHLEQDLDTLIRIKLAREKAQLRPKKAHTLGALARKLFRGWVEDKYKI